MAASELIGSEIWVSFFFKYNLLEWNSVDTDREAWGLWLHLWHCSSAPHMKYWLDDHRLCCLFINLLRVPPVCKPEYFLSSLNMKIMKSVGTCSLLLHEYWAAAIVSWCSVWIPLEDEFVVTVLLHGLNQSLTMGTSTFAEMWGGYCDTYHITYEMMFGEDNFGPWESPQRSWLAQLSIDSVSVGCVCSKPQQGWLK